MTLVDRISKTPIPQTAQDAIVRYIEHGLRPGSCLTAIFSNQLFEAYANADSEVAASMNDIVKYIYNYAPVGCWGSPEAVKSWIESGGWYGRLAAQAGKIPNGLI